MSSSALIGVGLYSVPEVSRLTGIPSSAISRWAFGHRYKYQDQTRYSQPIWPTQVEVEGTKGLGFHDLLEIRFVHAFKSYGVSLQAIRAASQTAREIFQSDHPFTCKRFRTDGRSIFADIAREGDYEDDEALLDLVKRQYAFRKVISPALYKGIVYDDDGIASVWKPRGDRHIVIDPKRSFGRPIEAYSGVPTEILYQAFRAEGEKSLVCKLYGVDKAALDAVIEFEMKISGDEILH
jgi:uncharacterized protein (DUF433 family)/DNA-binding transcriptional MerR regulator